MNKEQLLQNPYDKLNYKLVNGIQKPISTKVFTFKKT